MGKNNGSRDLIDFSDEISVIKNDNITLCYINDFSDKLKNHIKQYLTVVCYGPHINNPNEINEYPFNKTIKSFKERYDSKTPDMQKGMLGELLAHILINNYIEKLKVFSPYFNKEEANIRKGFDVLYIDTIDNCVRYGEVKSGELHIGKTITQTNNDLLYTAETDLKDKLCDVTRQVLWDNAKFDASLFRNVNENYNIHSLLNEDESTHLSNDKKVILISVCFHDINDKISIEQVKAFYERLLRRNTFSDAIIFSVQKNTLDKMKKFMFEECTE